MIGQEKLLNKLKSFSLNTLPHTILLVGKKGCGKHTMVNELSSYFDVDVVDISDEINNDVLVDIYLRTFKLFYLIDVEKITERNQNTLLKILEEPPKNAYMILISTSNGSLLNTVLNRCMVYEFEDYTKEELNQFVKEDSYREKALEVCSTPGQLITLNYKTLDDINDSIDKLIEKLNVVLLPSLLNLVDRINYGEEYDKFDLDIFLNILEKKLLKAILDNNTTMNYIKVYNILCKYRVLFEDSRLKKNQLFESMLIEMWQESRKENK